MSLPRWEPSPQPTGQPLARQSRGRSRGRLPAGSTAQHSVTLPVPGSVGAGPALLAPPLIQGCLLSLAQITEAGRTHELQPAKSPHGQMCVCSYRYTILFTHIHTQLEQRQQCERFPPSAVQKRNLKKKEERTSLYRAHLCQQENKPLIRSTLTSSTVVNNFSSPSKK